MWNQKTPYPPKDAPTPEPLVEAAPRVPTTSSMAARISALPQQSVSTIGKSITIKGEITGTEPLHIEGRVEGAIRLEGAYLNIGPEAAVQSNITAREVVVRGSVTGSINVTERIDIRSGGSLSGDVTAHSVSIEEGAYFKGSIDMRRSEAPKSEKPVAKATPPKPVEPEMAQAASV